MPREPTTSIPNTLRRTKVFIVSLHRCATQSVDLFLTEGGFRTCHWPSVVQGVDYESHVVGRETDLDFITGLLRPVFDSFDAVSDLPIPVLYRQLDAAYPNSLFIALRREAHGWLRSVRRHSLFRPLDPYERVQYWRYLSEQPTTLDDVTDDQLLAMYHQHYRALREYFGRRDDFVLLDVEEPEVGRRLSTFLGANAKDLPKIDYKDPTTHLKEVGALREALNRSRAEAEALSEDLASTRARAAHDASTIEALTTRLNIATRDLQRIEESVTWQLFQRIRTRMFAILGGEQSPAVALLQMTLRLVGRGLTPLRRGARIARSPPSGQR